MTIIRERHAFEGQKLAVISSIKRRGVLLILVILPNGSRSLIPASWTDWRGPHDTDPSSAAADVHALALGKFDDLLQLRKVIDALQRRHVESAPHVESSYAAEPLSRPSRSAVKPYSVEPVVDRLGSGDQYRPLWCGRAQLVSALVVTGAELLGEAVAAKFRAL